MSLNTPVAFIIFRRPQLAQQVFNQIKAAQPRQLFLIADGPRSPAEAHLCEQTRAIVEHIDWPCEVYRNYADENMGLRQRIVSGITWVFEHVERAIILEDDCLPHPTFFRFCAELLEHYAHDERVMTITGDYFGYPRRPTEAHDSYFFTHYPHVWGWATWKRAWARYDQTMEAWHNPTKRQTVLSRVPWWMRPYWTHIYEAVANNTINSWAYQWLLTCVFYDGLTATPFKNLVSHLGVGEGAAHFEKASTNDGVSFRPLEPMTFPLHHPEVKLNRAAEAYINRFTWVNSGQFFPLRVYRKARNVIRGFNKQ